MKKFEYLLERCKSDTIRNDVAEFIDNNLLLTSYEGEKYYELEDAIVDFIAYELNKHLKPGKTTIRCKR